MKLRSLAWRLAPLIVVFSCRDDITAPVASRSLTLNPRMAAVFTGVTPSISAGGYHTCVLKNDGTLTCFGYNPSGQSTPPADIGIASQVSLGTFHSCVVRTDTTPFCWGFNGEGQRAIPASVTSVRQISAAFHHTCAVQSDGTVACWGISDLQTQVPAGITTAIQISAGTLHTCALLRDNTVVCWGYNTDGELNVPAGLGPVAQVSVGEGFSCALKADGTVACWGNNRYGQVNVPTGLSSISQISAGYFHVCARMSDGTVRCWGNVGQGQTNVPTGVTSVSQVSAGQFHTCAVNTDGSVACWGDNSKGQATPPAGLNLTQTVRSQAVQFTSVAPNPGAVGRTYTLLADGTTSGNAVTFSSLTTTVCTVVGATASLIQAGTCTVAADQPAGNGYSAAPQATQTFTVVAPQPQSISFTSIPPDPGLVGGSYTVTATGGASGNGVLFNSLTTSVCLVLGNTVTFVRIGTCRISADQNGTDFYLPAVQQQQVFDINDVQSITFTSSPPSPAVVGGTYAVAATGGLSGNLVTFSSLSSGVCALSGNTVNLIGAGDCIVAADQAPGAGYLAAPRRTQTFNVIQPIPQIIAFTSSPPATAIVGGTYVVSLTGGASGNPIVLRSSTSTVCSVIGNIVTLARIGTCHITADQDGNAVYLRALQQEQIFDIHDVQRITFNSTPPDPGITGTNYSIAAFGGLSGNSVTFSSLSPTVCTISGSSANLIGAGTCIIAADQDAGAGYLAAHRETQSFTVIQQTPQSISFTSTPPNPAVVGASYSVTASGGRSGNPVQFGSLTPTICFVLGNTVSLNARGTCRIAADQAGNTYYLAAPQQVQIFDINDVQTITFTSTPPNSGVVGQTYSVAATGGLSGNSVTFSSLSTSVCTVTGNTASLVGAGTCTVAADQAEGNGYLAAPRQTQGFTVVQPIAQSIDFTSAPPDPAVVGGLYTVSATGGASGNAVHFTSLTPNVCSVAGSSVALNTRGTCRLAANQAGNAFYLQAGQQVQFFEIYDVQGIAFTSAPPDPAIVGNRYVITASGGASGSAVTFTSLSTSTCTVNNAIATFTSPGTCTIAADQAAGNDYLAAPRQTQRFAVLAAQIISFTSTAPNPGVVGGVYSVTARGGESGNSVLFGSLTPSVCFVTGSTVNLIARGTCRVAADQAGNTQYVVADQQVQIFDIYDVQAIAFISTPPNPAVVGETYAVAASGGLSGNSVTFSSLSATVCSVSGNTVTLSGAGTCVVAADQAQGNGYLAAPRQTQNFAVVQPIAQSIDFTSTPPNPGLVGSIYNVSASGGASGNSVLFSSLTPTVCSVTGNRVSLNTRGSCVVAADQAGTTLYLTARQTTQPFEIFDVQSIDFTSAPPAPAVVGNRYAITASGGASGNAVSFSSLTTNTCTVVGATATFTGSGTCTIAADQAEGNDYLRAPRQTQSFAVFATQTIAFTSTPANPSVVGASYTVSASGGGSGNPVLFSSQTPSVCFVLGNSVSLSARGTCRIAADQTGNAFYLPASQAIQVFDIYDVQAINFTSTTPAPGVVGNTYSVIAVGGLSGNAVTFSSLSTSVCTLSGSSVALNDAGTCIIAADQAAGGGYLAAPRNTQSFTVIRPIPQTINFTSAPPDPAVVGASYSVSASGGASGNPVLFSSLTPNVCFVLGNTVSLNGRGTCRVAADQTGNTFYLPAAEATQAFDIDGVQTITFTSAPPAPAVVGATYAISATGGLSANLVTFTSLSTSVCTLSGSTAAFNGAGTCIIAADQAGGSGYLAAPRKTQSVTVINPIPQAITFTSTPPNPPVVGGAYTVTATGGASGNPVIFSSLTPGTCGISGAMVSFTAAGGCTIAANQAGNSPYLPANQVTQSLVIDTRPVANAGSAQTGYEGSAVTFNAAGSSDADGDALISYNWNFGDGTSQSVSTATVQHVYNDNSSTPYVVTLTVTDARGATSSPVTTSAAIANVAPTATFAPASPINEGTMILSLTSVSDALGDLPTLQYAFDCGDGSGYQPFGSSASFACSPVDNGVRTVRAKVRDKDGGMSEYTGSVTVLNVAPTITLVSAPTNGNVGVDYTIQFRFSDPGTTDSPWSYQTTWGDGTKTAVIAATTQGLVITQTHRYSIGSTYTITVRVTDKDGGTSTATVRVTIARPLPLPGG